MKRNTLNLVRALLFITGCTACWPALVSGQSVSNLRQRQLVITWDSLEIDTLSIVPGSMQYLTIEGTQADTSGITYDAAKAMLYFSSDRQGDTLTVVYRVFPVLLTQSYRKKDRDLIEKGFGGQYNPYSYPGASRNAGLLKMEGLNRSGNLSRGISFGNNQDLVVNSSFNLQLAGNLGEGVEILAAITDNNIPVQPEGNTQQIQDFDNVFIQLSKNKSKLIVGDFELRRPSSYFMNFFKKGQGASFVTEYPVNKDKTAVMRSGLSGAISKGRYARNVFNGVEANQGPYRLKGSENETFIVVLAGSEKVFIDGQELTRGEQNDYIIDYNTADITFTTRRLITKDTRIVVEFQYSDKNYTRTMYFMNQEYQDSRLKLRASFFSEQDSKNQPLLQDLNDEQKLLLAAVGDSLQYALEPNIDSVAFNSNEVLYEKVDSAGYVFYRYATDSTVAYYRLGFSFVGQGKGNYVPIPASANGRVFQWVPPVGGVLQGSYEPVRQLISPKKQQMLTVGGEYLLSSKTKVFGEFAFSNYNQNLFSSKDKADDQGLAATAGFESRFNLQNDTVHGWKLVTGLSTEFVDERFTQLETFRSIEFNRDWNLNLNALEGNEYGMNAEVSLLKERQRIYYRFKTFIKGTDYEGYMNLAGADVTFGKYRLVTDGSFLISGGDLYRSQFIRSKTDFNRTFKGFNGGIKFDQEYNKQKNPELDQLLAGSYAYYKPSLYIASADTGKVKFRLDGSRRIDFGYALTELKESTVADEVVGSVEFSKNPRSVLTLQSTYRNLRVSDSTITFEKNSETLLNRVQYNFTIWNGALISSTYYEAGTGQEPKQDYAYVEVAPGTGVYTYAGDYNGNGVKDIDEFEVAAFADEANFIKVFIPTNEYVKTKTNQFSQVFNINPAAYFRNKENKQQFISRFSDQISYRVDNKTTEKDLIKALNPFQSNIDDSLLLTKNSAFRNTIYFNRTSTTTGADFTWQNNESKSLLTNGFESRSINSLLLNVRWNINKIYGLAVAGEQGVRKSNSEYSPARDYEIVYYRAEPKFSIQPTVSFRTTFSYEYKVKDNNERENGEHSLQHKGGIDIKYSSARKGVFSARFNLINIEYEGDQNSSVAYEMLEGLNPGTNFTWGASVQRNLSNAVQISLNYDGRKPQGSKPVHTGTVSARAFF